MHEMLTRHKEIREEEEQGAEDALRQELTSTVDASKCRHDHSTDDEHICNDLEKLKRERERGMENRRITRRKGKS